jgi:hypothetical protein
MANDGTGIQTGTDTHSGTDSRSPQEKRGSAQEHYGKGSVNTTQDDSEDGSSHFHDTTGGQKFDVPTHKV